MCVIYYLFYLLLLIFVLFVVIELMGLIVCYCCMWCDDLVIMMVIGWDQVFGINLVLYFDEIDYGGQANVYCYCKVLDCFIRVKGM